MKPEPTLPRLQQTVTYPYPETNQSRPCPLPHVLKIHFNITLPSTPRSSNWPLSLRCTNHNPICTYMYYHSHTRHKHLPSHSSWFDQPGNIWWSAEFIMFLIMYSSLILCHLVPLSSRYTPLRFIFEHPNSVYCRTVQHTDTNKDLMYAATPPPY